MAGPDPKMGLVRSNSFALRDMAKHREVVRDSVLGVSRSYLASRRMSKSLPELHDIRLPGHSGAPGEEGDERESEYSSDGDSFVVHDINLKPTWVSKGEFFLTQIALLIGMNNIWRFPYVCYRFGGGTFLFAYLILSVFCGLPLVCLEFAVGQVTQQGLISALGSLCPILKGMGVASAILSLVMTPLYSSLNSWSLFYLFKTFFKTPPWTTCENWWNNDTCVSTQDVVVGPPVPPILLTTLVNGSDSDDIPHDNSTSHNEISDDDFNSTHLELPHYNSSHLFSHLNAGYRTNLTYASSEFFDVRLLELNLEDTLSFGRIHWELLISLVISWLCLLISLRKSSSFAAHPAFFLAIIPQVGLLALLFRAAFLKGMHIGIAQFLNPDFDALEDPELWLYAAGVLFHSLGVVLGTSLSLAVCNREHNNFVRDGLFAWMWNTFTIILLDAVTYATLGHMSFLRNKPINELLPKDPSVAYVVFSELLATLPLAPLWSFMFFVMLFIIGIDFQISMVQTFMNSFGEAYERRIKQRFGSNFLFLMFICILMFLCTLLYLTQKGIIFMVLLEHYFSIVTTVTLALFEVIAFGWVYGATLLSDTSKERTGVRVPVWLQFCWGLVTPSFLIAIVAFNIYYYNELLYFRDGAYQFPLTFRYLMQILVIIIIALIPIIGWSQVKRVDKSNFFSKLVTACKPKKDQRLNYMSSHARPVILKNGAILTKHVETLPIQCNTRSNSRAASSSSSSTLFAFHLDLTQSVLRGLDRETDV